MFPNAIVVVSAVLLLLAVVGLDGEPLCSTCPPSNRMNCHVPITYNPDPIKKDCYCSYCSTLCYERNSICPRGQTCRMVDCPNGVPDCKTAECVPEYCPNCPPLTSMPCDLRLNYNPDPGNGTCLCLFCMTRCFDRLDPCPIGTTCKMTSTNCPPKGLTGCLTAECVPFTGCEKKECVNQCPRQGYIRDRNGCETCTCENPCLEFIKRYFRDVQQRSSMNFANRWVLRSALNFVSDGEVDREGGREFQRKGPEKANADLFDECVKKDLAASRE
ncbi:hypothetical protein HELRODRAFT_175388 [Helobdella robusta]|uniref:Antistasin-like domain-containing protein n=1 Tax=Helobdella robusta TaxID=6412 RepID=T1F981_HELRO|nr:hypothetical protein HELRODRAFT_175388 [Helobdella robusta]ESO00892.1 hypothetical protein HELRODRAFT_175388 [Helobdella robusta]